MDGRRLETARGFALLEVLITLVISLLALVALIRLQGDLLHGDAQARARTQAALLAEEQMEMLYGAIALDGPEAGSDGEDAWTIELDPADGDAITMYTRAWSIDDSGGSASINVSLQWNDRAGATRNIVLDTLVDPVTDSYGAAAWTDIDFIRLE
ncbi:MAG: hypothetical protein IT488_03550 [Gammaproteobacteria bacterium]|nr:hypothetical protein [Gammaproteobacteria bacterium]